MDNPLVTELEDAEHALVVSATPLIEILQICLVLIGGFCSTICKTCSSAAKTRPGPPSCRGFGLKFSVSRPS